MSDVMTARLGEELIRDVSMIAETEHLDKSTALRRLLDDATTEWKKKYAIKLYSEGKYSAEQASKFAKLSIWAFFDLLKQKRKDSSFPVFPFFSRTYAIILNVKQ